MKEGEGPLLDNAAPTGAPGSGPAAVSMQTPGATSPDRQVSPGDAERGFARQSSSFMRQLSDKSFGNSMEWTGVSLTVKGGGGGKGKGKGGGDKNATKVILDNVSGNVKSGETACILGPSGAGKSTLLNILAGRMNTKAPGMTDGGVVSIGGSIVDPVSARSNIAYVMQEDALPGMSTPREILAMSAVLRGVESDTDAVQGKVSELLTLLRLDKCADTYVGTALVKGLSGGEKKRTAVAVELITAPKMIFLDEPLSGLDSYAAWTVVQVCKDELAKHGCAVMCTVHQPSSEIFNTFDKVICLADGRTVYCDTVAALNPYMTKVGHATPQDYNPADHLLFFVQKISKEELTSFADKWAEEEKVKSLKDIEYIRTRSTALPPRDVPRKSCFLQLKYLVTRELNEVIRNKVGLIFRFVITAVMNLLFAFIFQGIGKNNTAAGFQGHFGAICNVMIGTMFGSSQPLLLQFAMERPIFLREYATNMYGTIPYFVAKTLIELPLSFLTALESWLIAYWIMGFQGNFFWLVMAAWALSCTAASTALMMGCSVSTAQSAQELAPLMFVPQILFTGIFVPIKLVPVWLRWMQYLASLKYAINIACVVEFKDDPVGMALLENQDIQSDKIWLYCLVLGAIFAGFRILAMINLRRRAKFVF